MGDIKKYIISKKTRSFTIKLGLWELITGRHISMGPATKKENKKRQAIYGICGSQEIKIAQGRYPPFNLITKSDHRLLWVKLSHPVAFGDKNNSQITSSERT